MHAMTTTSPQGPVEPAGGAHALLLAATADIPPALRSALEAQGLAVAALCCAARPDELRAALRRHLAGSGAPAVVVNVLSPVDGPVPAAEDVVSERWQRAVDATLTRTLVACQVLGRAMVDAGRGTIVSVLAGSPGDLVSTVADNGVVGLMRVLAVEWAAAGVRVATVAPAGPPSQPRDLEVARAVAFLGSAEAGYVTGTELVVGS